MARGDTLQAGLNETRQTLRDTVGERNALDLRREELEQTLAVREASLEVCRTSAGQLHAVSGEILQRLATRGGLLQVVLDSEPFTGIGEVTLENIVQDYRFRLRDLWLTADGRIAPAD